MRDDFASVKCRAGPSEARLFTVDMVNGPSVVLRVFMVVAMVQRTSKAWVIELFPR
jgi:hypothetical protein